jgi:hypothetical protein
MNSAGKATGLGWPDSASDDVSRETSDPLATGLGWPDTAAPETLAAPSENVSRETSDEDAS